MKKVFGLLILFSAITLYSVADEGLWIPMLVEKYNIGEMQERGLKLSADDIYSVNQACLKDAVVLFGGGCTGEIISEDGLLLTNHHCGYSFIQNHSTVEDDYLSGGFWASSREEELPNPDLSVKILVRMENITELICGLIPDDAKEELRNAFIDAMIYYISDSVANATGLNVSIEPFYYGNEYYMVLYEEFMDIRLVGAPPSSIGKFGGDTDNWVWPRHTGDFTLFRVYATEDNKPSEYSKKNVPYKPKAFLPISLKGIDDGDFTMVYGYPFKTEEYLTSYAVDQLINIQLPKKINIREGRLKIIEEAMRSDPSLQIKYASKQARIANGWKKWIGVEKGLMERNTIQRKQEFEEDIIKWLGKQEAEYNKYEDILEGYEQIYKELEKYILVYEYGYEVINASALLSFVTSVIRVVESYGYDVKSNKKELRESLEEITNAYFDNTYLPVDIEEFRFLISSYYKDIQNEFHPTSLSLIDKKFNGKIDRYLDHVLENTIYNSKEKMLNMASDFSVDKFQKDPLTNLFYEILLAYTNDVYPPYEIVVNRLDSLNRQYMKCIVEYKKGNIIYPDANGTLRLTYGKVEGYEPSDGIKYDYITTLEGIMEKEKMGVYDYIVPDRLTTLYTNKDYGRYGVDGMMPVCFLASNHTTGGNSGSPVLNAEGHLIGINFDRNWEGTMSDIMYNPDICRNISVDIRYVLFIIDKYAGAGYLLDEMNIIE